MDAVLIYTFTLANMSSYTHTKREGERETQTTEPQTEQPTNFFRQLQLFLDEERRGNDVQQIYLNFVFHRIDESFEVHC